MSKTLATFKAEVFKQEFFELCAKHDIEVSLLAYFMRAGEGLLYSGLSFYPAQIPSQQIQELNQITQGLDKMLGAWMEKFLKEDQG